MDYSKLHAELTEDPLGLGYAAMTDVQAADALNSLVPGRQIKRADISPSEIWEAINMGDLATLPTNPNASQLSQERRDLMWLGGVAGLPSIRLLNEDGTDTQVRSNLTRIFSAATPTRARLLALATRTVSRGEELGLGTVGEGYVKTARAGTW